MQPELAVFFTSIENNESHPAPRLRSITPRLYFLRAWIAQGRRALARQPCHERLH